MQVSRKDVGALNPAKQVGMRKIFDALISRSGIQEYMRADGSIQREYRPPEEVFSDESIRSFELAPVTLDHPVSGQVTPDSSHVVVGCVDGVLTQDADHLRTRLCVFDQYALDAIERGVQELSCGYDCELDMTPGVTPDGQAYDAVQRNIRGNHVAIVERGRAGTARLRADGLAMLADCDTLTSKETHDAMTLEEMRAELEALKLKMSALEGERDAAIAARSAEAARADASIAQLPQLVQARLALVKQAQDAAVTVDDAMSDAQIKLAVIKARLHIDVAEDRAKDAAYVEGLFTAAAAARKIERTRDDFAPQTASAKPVTDYAAVEAEFQKRQRDIWKGAK